jgi:uncharacterized membrane protein YfcA
MDLFAAINPPLVVSGFVVGLLVGLTGVGGGSLMTPLLVLLFGVHATTAVGTDLLYAAITKTGGTLTHGLKGLRRIRWFPRLHRREFSHNRLPQKNPRR